MLVWVAVTLSRCLDPGMDASIDLTGWDNLVAFALLIPFVLDKVLSVMLGSPEAR
jgi:hypothetical protein